MQGDNDHPHQEASSRVRRVPIQIESRDNYTRGGQKQFVERNRADQHTSYNYDGPNKTLPDSTSIKINYNPKESDHSLQNDTKTRYNSHDQFATSTSNNSELIGNQQENKQTSTYDECEHGQNSQNQEKLVSPPEVIPLPPPPKSPEPNISRDSNNSPNQQQSQQQPLQQSCKTNEKAPKDVLTCVNDVKLNATNLLKAIASFSGTSAKSKEYRYLDEMLTRCILTLDQIECGDSTELRQYRKAAIKLVDKATDILQRKLQINSDLQDLSSNMGSP